MSLRKLLCLALILPLAAALPAEEEPADTDKTIYALGASIAPNLKAFSLSDQEVEHLLNGLRDGIAGEVDLDLNEWQDDIRSLAQARAQVAMEKEKAASSAFLDKESAKDASKTYDSGLIMTTLKKGTGASPQPSDKVRVHYKGTLIDGTEFDSSYSRNEPAEFPLNGVIPCWTEGVGKMKVGGKARLVCPSDIAYGDRGRPPVIPGGATLVFEVELLDILQ